MAQPHVFPWWAGYLLLSPLRKRSVDPMDLLRPYVREGTLALDAGCAMGFFSLPLAGLVGESGRVVCVDMQKRMIVSLRRRAERAGLADRIDARLCSQNSLMLGDLPGRIGFALAFGVVHEVPDRGRFLGELHRALARGGRLLIGEPRWPVPAADFRETVDAALAKGFILEREWALRGSRLAVFKKD